MWGVLYALELVRALVPWGPVLDSHSDRTLNRIAKKLGSAPLHGPKTLLLTGYYFGKSHILIDTLLYISLTRAGHRVIPVVTGKFFTKECLYFGGKYKDWRFLRINTVAAIELKIWRGIMGVEPVLISDYFYETTNRDFHSLNLPNLNFHELKNVSILGFNIFSAATRVHANMTDSPVADENPSDKKAIFRHCSNIAKYLLAFNNLLEQVQPSYLVCNSPFYYKWSVPTHLAKCKNVKVYTYMLSEKPNSFFFTKITDYLLQVEDLPGALECFTEKYNLNDAMSLDTIRDEWLNFYSSPSRTHYAATYGLVDTEENKKKNEDKSRNRSLGNQVLIPLNHPSDASVLQGSPMFSDYRSFLNGMVELASKFPSLNFVFKIHPAEKLHEKNPGFNSSLVYLKDAGLGEQKNCQVIPANTNTPVSTIIGQSDLVICYTSTVALTACILGVTTVQCSFSSNRSQELVECPDTFEEVIEILVATFLKKNPNLYKLRTRSRNALLYSMFHYLHSQIDTGLFVTDDITRKGYIRSQINESDILNNPYLNFVAETISKNKSFSSKDGLPPDSGPASLVNGRLLVR